jgi:hypothetical protein
MSTIVNDAGRRVAALDGLGLLEDRLENRFERVLAMMSAFFRFPLGAVVLAGRDALAIKATHGFATKTPDLQGSITEAVMLADDVVFVGDATLDPRFRSSPMVTGAPHVRSFLGVSLHAPGGETIGMVGLAGPVGRSIDEEDIANFRRVALWIEEELSRETESRRAVQVQRALQPRSSVTIHGYDIAGASTPSREVGGDFFDWYRTADGFGFVLADVMGKGTASALIAATVRAVVRVSRNREDLAATVRAADEILDHDLRHTDSFTTLFHGRLHAGSGTVDYVDAGHGLSLLVHADGSFDRLAHEDFPLGTGLGGSWTAHSARLDEGDTLVIFSDGVLDLFDGSFGSFSSLATLANECGTASRLVDTLTSMAEADESTDDVVVIAIRRSDDRPSRDTHETDRPSHEKAGS